MEEKQNLYEQKVMHLHEILQKLTSQNVAVAFSAGVDSSLLLQLAVEHAKQHNTTVFAYTAVTVLHPACDESIAKKVALEIGCVHKILKIDEMQDAGIEQNPVNRCYLCKKLIFQTMQRQAKEDQAFVLMEGTNKDDTLVYRPGLKALSELGIKSPLLEAGFTKEEVRRLAKSYGISTAQRPSTPCMATRFPYNTRLTEEGLTRVARAEDYLKTLGFYNIRLRVHDNLARIEVDEDAFQVLLMHREEIIKQLKELGFDYITMDLVGFRSGSMDEILNKKKISLI